MVNSEASSAFRARWADLKFPPINLWVMASLAYEPETQQRGAYVQSMGKPSKRNTSNTLHKLHRRLETLLAVRGGKI